MVSKCSLDKKNVLLEIRAGRYGLQFESLIVSHQIRFTICIYFNAFILNKFALPL